MAFRLDIAVIIAEKGRRIFIEKSERITG